MRAIAAVVTILALLVAPVVARADAMEQAPAVQTIAAARFSALAEKAVHALVNDSDHSVRADYRFTDQLVPAGKVTIVAQAAQVNPTYVAIPLLISVDGKPIRTIYAGFRVITYVKTAVAAHTLGANTVLTADDLVLGRVESTGRQPIDVASLVGRKLNVTAAAGAPVYIEQTRQNDLVVAGQPAIYILHDGPIVVSADVIARSSGAIGQVVAVYNPNTRKDLSGVVTGPGKVEYTLPGEEAQ